MQNQILPLAKIVKDTLLNIDKLYGKVLFSTEDPIPSDPSTLTDEELPEGRRSIPGSVAFVPSVAGLIIAGEVIKDLTSK